MPPTEDVDETELHVGEDEMPENGQGCCDICCDAAVLLLEEQLGAHDALMLETRATVDQGNAVVRLSGARKFNQEDPIEAAAAEMILQKNTP